LNYCSTWLVLQVTGNSIQQQRWLIYTNHSRSTDDDDRCVCVCVYTIIIIVAARAGARWCWLKRKRGLDKFIASTQMSFDFRISDDVRYDMATNIRSSSLAAACQYLF
jgi:hypothetical protein